MIATTLRLRPGDVVVLPPPPFPERTRRTVADVQPMGVDAPAGPLFVVSYVEPSDEQWSRGNSGAEFSLWLTTSWRTLAAMLAR